jgi:hypothetical protein
LLDPNPDQHFNVDRNQCCGAGAEAPNLNCLLEPEPKFRITAPDPASDPYHLIKDLKKFYRKKVMVASINVRKESTEIKDANFFDTNKTVCDIKKIQRLHVGAGAGTGAVIQIYGSPEPKEIFPAP